MKTTKKTVGSTKKTKRPDRSPRAAKSTEASVPARAKDMPVRTEDLSGLRPKNEARVEIKPAKGRPMLTWVGKKPLRHASAYPAQLVESFNARPGARHVVPLRNWNDWPKDMPQMGLLLHGDNKDVLAYLLANGFRGKVKLIYIDPPFDSGADYVRKVNLRGNPNLLSGEEYTLGEQVQYADIWAHDNYLQFVFERLLLLKELLAENGSIYLHTDSHRTHHLRCLMDEVFSADYFRNDIVWQRFTYHADAKRFGIVHDTILYYSKSNDVVWNQQYKEHREEYIESHFTQREKDGRVYRLDSLVAQGQGPSRRFGEKVLEPRPGTHWRYSQDNIDELMKAGMIVFSDNGRPQVKRYLDEIEGAVVHSIWTDIKPINSQAGERTEYPTQKPESLLERVISASSNVDDIILDCFIGSGTTAAVAQKLGRRWIGADINKGAIQTTTKRLQGVMQEQAEKAKNEKQKLPGMEESDETPAPAQLGFVVYRVNDYDLQMQHNEAFNLAVEHLGMMRTKTDSFFDGTLGKKLVKIVPFNHPVTALDLEEVKNELNARPEEERDIVVVGMGKEIAVEAWLEEWNKLRKQGNIPNKIEVIELRSDPKYGGFFTHEPAKAKVAFKKVAEGLEITIEDFISPTILERLRQQNKDNPLFQPQVSDWRSMVDSVMIDSAYDGEVFNITLADVPERKNDLVEGKYVVEAKKGATVAVKVTDMLGEEVLVVKEI